MSRPLWLVRMVQYFFPSRFFLAKCTRIPILGKLIHYFAFHKDRIFYLPRDRVIEMNRPVSTLEEVVLPTQIVKHFILSAKHHWIMDKCICRDSSGCKDYPIDLGCLFMGESVVGINRKLGHRVTREEALLHIQKCQDAGLVHLIGRNKLDTLWLGIGPAEKLLTVCHCCPCCCLWKMLPHLDTSIGRNVTKLPGVNVRVTDNCNGCDVCTSGICFVDAIRVNGDHAEIGVNCRGCGRCAELCPENAVEIQFDVSLDIRKAIDVIGKVVHVA